MVNRTDAESALFADLTRLLLAMRSASHGDVEAAIEERFRSFVRAQAAEGVAAPAGELQVTFTWTLPEGPDDWAVYGTEYLTVPIDPQAVPRQAAIAAGASEVIAFPPSHPHRPASTQGRSAVIIAFPGR